jgi:hypothetical protein
MSSACHEGSAERKRGICQRRIDPELVDTVRQDFPALDARVLS